MALRILIVVFAIIIVALLWALFFYHPVQSPTEGMTPGIPPTAPAAIVSGDGTLAIATSSLQPDMVISSPLVLRGEVTGGGWFFEGTFPVKVMDARGTVLGTAAAHAETEWTSTGTVPWTATVTFAPPAASSGLVVFESDNPSGDPARMKTLQVPVKFR